jgi:hypothetical protein
MILFADPDVEALVRAHVAAAAVGPVGADSCTSAVSERWGGIGEGKCGGVEEGEGMSWRDEEAAECKRCSCKICEEETTC